MKRLSAALTAVAAAVAATGLAAVTATPAAAATVATVYGLTTGNAIVTFSSTTPGTVSAPRPIQPLLPGENVVGIDVRPADGEIYGVTSTSRIIRISATGAIATATPIGGAINPALQGENFGVDFNPTVDRLRVVSDAGQNLRINPNDVSVAVDSAIAGARPTAAAYTNSFAPANPGPMSGQTTVLYDIDTTSDRLFQQAPPNTGGVADVGPLGVDATGVNGFDITNSDNTALAALQVGEASSLYSVSLTTGAATLVGAFPAGTVLRGLTAASPGRLGFAAATSTVGEGAGAATITVTRTAGSAGTVTVDYAVSAGTGGAADFTPTSGTLSFAPGDTTKSFTVPVTDDAATEGDETLTITLSNRTGGAGTAASGNTTTLTITDNDPATVYGSTSDNRLVQFTTNEPGTFSRPTVPITGLQSGETVVGLDFRPTNGALYALTSGSRVYTVDRATGRATLAPVGQLAPPLNGSAFGVDFNPVPDRLRVVSDNDQNLRVNVDTSIATATTVDGTPAYAPADQAAGVNPTLTAVAYTNSSVGATSTTLYGVDTARDVLVRVDTPNSPVLATVGPLGVQVSDTNGFDILPTVAGGAAFAAFVPQGATTSSLYRVDLASGRADLQGAIGTGSNAVTLTGLTFAPATAPVEPDPVPAAVAIALQTRQITAGNNPNVIATVSDSAGAAVAGAQVELLGKRYRETSYTRVGTVVTTGPDGRAVFNVRPDRQTAYIARVVGGPQSRSIVQFVYARINVTSPAPETTVGRDLTFRGNTVPNYGRGVAIGLGLLRDGRFSVITQAPTDAAGNFVINARNLPLGTGAYVVFTSARNGTLKGAKSLRLTVR